MSSDSDDPDAFTSTLLRSDPEYGGVVGMDVDENARFGVDQSKLTVRFVTSLPDEFRVVETPFEVPSDFARLVLFLKGLSEIVNHLLGLNPKVPFDFLIDNQFLRTSLKQWLKTQGSERSVVTIQYVKALVTPTLHKDSLHKDWIKAICASDESGLVASAAFDGSIRLFDSNKDFAEIGGLSQVLEGGREIWDAKWLVGGKQLLCGGKSGNAKVLQLR